MEMVDLLNFLSVCVDYLDPCEDVVNNCKLSWQGGVLYSLSEAVSIIYRTIQGDKKAYKISEDKPIWLSLLFFKELLTW